MDGAPDACKLLPIEFLTDWTGWMAFFFCKEGRMEEHAPTHANAHGPHFTPTATASGARRPWNRPRFHGGHGFGGSAAYVVLTWKKCDRTSGPSALASH